MAQADDNPENVIYKGMIFEGKVTLQAWSIAARIQPDRTKSEERMGLAIAAQIGLNHDQKIPDPNPVLRRKLNAIQSILDE